MNCARLTPRCAWSSACDQHPAPVPPAAHRRARVILHQQSLLVIIVHGTRAFRDRVQGPAVRQGERCRRRCSGPSLRPCSDGAVPAALLVNELTLLPLVVPLAPAKTLLTRFPVLGQHVTGSNSRSLLPRTSAISAPPCARDATPIPIPGGYDETARRVAGSEAPCTRRRSWGALPAAGHRRHVFGTMRSHWRADPRLVTVHWSRGDVVAAI